MAGASGLAPSSPRRARLPLAGRVSVIYDLRGMWRPPQDRAALCGNDAVLRTGAAALALAAITVLLAFPSVSLAAQAGCGGKPGSKDHAALLQYCPEHKHHHQSGAAPTATGVPPAATPPTAAAVHHAKAKTKETGSRTEIPLTGYPSSTGINLLLILLVLVAIGAAVAYGARRWRRSRPQTS
jgi:hypothetical protein